MFLASLTALYLQSAELDPALRGQVRIARSGCIDCHAGAALAREPAPDLSRVATRLAPEFLRALIESPSSIDPDTAMPDVLAALEPDERTRAVDELLHFLETLGEPFPTERVAVSAGELESGRQLFHSVGCVPCHGPQESLDDLSSPLWDFELANALAPHVPAFPDPARATNVASLAAFLRDPVSVHPGGRMPSLALDEREARAIAVYLSRSRLDPIVEQPGLAYDYFEGTFTTAARGFGGAPRVRSGVVETIEGLPKHREDRFGFEFQGLLRVDDAGTHRFALRSDDGSRLWLDGKLVVENDGDHAPQTKTGEVWLAKGRHELAVAFYEAAGGEELALKWTPPNGEETALPAERLSHWQLELAPDVAPFAVDAEQARRGRERYVAVGCVRCHELEGVADSRPKPGNMARIAAHADRGCLADAPPPDAPHYALETEDRAELRAALRHSLEPITDEARGRRERIDLLLADSNCFACHRRDGHGGPDETNQGYFKALVDADLGNEGRFPPALDGVGAKLRREWIEKVLAGRGVERPYLATRMPVFGERRVFELPVLFADVDAGGAEPQTPAFDEARAEIGRKLAGDKGLACIQCHSFNGTKSLGIPAVDLGHVAERIRPQWFADMLLDPQSVGMNSRMSTFWSEENGKLVSPVKDEFDGDPRRQIDALWQYMSLGRGMPMPDGLVIAKSEYEVEVGREPRMVGVFFAGASPRTMLVGFPERTHIAFDVEHSCLVAAWRGHFFSGEGTWLGRAGGLEKPQGEDAIEFARTAPFAVLERDADPWPTAVGRDAGYRVLGWKRDAEGRPVFRYALGGVEIEELDHPLLSPGVARLRREFVLRAPRDVQGLRFMLVAGDEVSRTQDGAYSAGRHGVRVVDARAAVEEASFPERVETRLPIRFERDGGAWSARVAVEVTW